MITDEGLTVRSGRSQRRNRIPSHHRRPCHQRAIHSGPDRSPADNHGQRRISFDLRAFRPPQVKRALDLALGAGGRCAEVSLLQLSQFLESVTLATVGAFSLSAVGSAPEGRKQGLAAE
jgi:hypothetical protein